MEFHEFEDNQGGSVLSSTRVLLQNLIISVLVCIHRFAGVDTRRLDELMQSVSVRQMVSGVRRSVTATMSM